MSDRARNTVFGITIALTAVLIGVLVLTGPTEVDRVANVGSRIKCPVCQGESIANSPAQMARDMMSLVAERVGDGVSDQAIVDELLASYSGAVLLDPPASGGTLVLWLAPLGALAIGVAVIEWWRRHPGPEDSAELPPSEKSRRRMLIGGLVLAVSFGVIVVVAGFFLQERSGPTSGVASFEIEDLDSVSNETMEAVIAANADDPQINGMRLALAERYFDLGDYGSAFPHYLAVAESEIALDGQAVTALVRLGWMAWDGNGAADPAIGMFDQALAIDAGSTTARYLKGQVLWCGTGDAVAAAALFTEILTNGDLTADTRETVEADLFAAAEGLACA
jgi:cytochrome c-type biogenesis protein CcmH